MQIDGTHGFWLILNVFNKGNHSGAHGGRQPDLLPSLAAKIGEKGRQAAHFIWTFHQIFARHTSSKILSAPL